MATSDKESSSHHPRPFWSGVIAFGLVSLPVSLFPANRSKSFSLSMVDDEGVQLRRRYFCEKDENLLESDDIVRGFPIEKDRFVVVEDEELEALAPEKTREIDLRRFVPMESVDPVFFERGYFLAPDSGATKAYRLLAKSMEEEQRVGIATFVMRDREYIIAIIAEGGILRAETLRFYDEIRSPEMVGLPKMVDLEEQNTDKKLLREMRKAIETFSEDQFEREILVEKEVSNARELVKKKLEKGTDIIKLSEGDGAQGDGTEDDSAEEESNVVDLMQVLKERLKGKSVPLNKKGDSSNKKINTPAKKSHKKSGNNISALNRAELYERAQKLHIDGRSKMTKAELLAALKDAG